MPSLADLLQLVHAADTLQDAARNRAAPRPLVSGRSVLLLALIVGGSGFAYAATFHSLGGSPRLVFGIALICAAAVVLLLAGNQLDAAITRRKLAARAARRARARDTSAKKGHQS